MTDATACIITSSTPLIRSPDVRETYITYRWRSYDAAQHLLRDIFVDAEGNPLPLDAASNSSTYTKLSDHGRTMVSALEVGAGELQRSDYARDTRGNLISFRQARTAQRDLGAPPPEQPSVSYDFVNHYDTSGLIRKHSRADSSASIGYTHDSSGRCELIVDDVQREHREYDANGRLSTRQVDPLEPEPPADPLGHPSSSITTYRYDDQGRLIAIEQDGGSFWALPIDGQPDIQTLWTYANDGSFELEVRDFTSDTPNDTVERNGQMVSLRRGAESWSAGCEAVQASLPAPEGQACSAD